MRHRPVCCGLFAIFAVYTQGGCEGGEETAEYVVVGHCCESGDLLTPAPGSASEIEPRLLGKAEIGG